MTLPAGNLTVAGGTGSNPGASGTVTVSNTPQFLMLPSTPGTFHETETLSWTAVAVNPAEVTADVYTYGSQQSVTLATDQSVYGSVAWDTMGPDPKKRRQWVHRRLA